MSWLTPHKDFSRGVGAYLKGMRWLKAHPRYLIWLSLPSLGGGFALATSLGLFWRYRVAVTQAVLFEKPIDSPGMLLVYQGLVVCLTLALFVLALLGALLVVNLLAAPIYDYVSAAVERDWTGTEPPALGLRATCLAMLAEMKKVALIFMVSILLLLIPGLNVISLLSAAFLAGWDFFDYPLARRGWPLRRRLHLVMQEFWAVLGFGLWLVIPFAQVIMMPLAVAGGTLLNLDALERHRILTPVGRKEGV